MSEEQMKPSDPSDPSLTASYPSLKGGANSPYITYNERAGDYERSGFFFIELDGGDHWVRVDQIAHLERLHLSGPGHRTLVYLVNGKSFAATSSIEEIWDAVVKAQRLVIS